MPLSTAFEYGEKAYTLVDCIVAAYTIGSNTYGTPAALAGGQMVTVEPESDNDKLRVYGVNAALLSVPVGAKLTIGAGGIDFSVASIFMGTTDSSSGTTPNRIRKVKFPAGGSGLAYFGVIGLAATDDGGYQAIGLQCCKLDVEPKFEFDGKSNKFNTSEMSAYAIPINISSTPYLMVAGVYESTAAWTAPATAGNFLAFFTSASP